MPTSEILHLAIAALVGGLLIALGVVAGAVADRIRGRTSAPAPAPEYRASKPAGRHRTREAIQIAHGVDVGDVTGNVSPATAKMALDVERALVTAGYDKATAQIAVAACAGSERATLEAWTRAALRRAMKGGEASC